MYERSKGKEESRWGITIQKKSFPVAFQREFYQYAHIVRLSRKYKDSRCTGRMTINQPMSAVLCSHAPLHSLAQVSESADTNTSKDSRICDLQTVCFNVV
jgi:hypothetical protein